MLEIPAEMMIFITIPKRKKGIDQFKTKNNTISSTRTIRKGINQLNQNIPRDNCHPVIGNTSLIQKLCPSLPIEAAATLPFVKAITNKNIPRTSIQDIFG